MTQDLLAAAKRRDRDRDRRCRADGVELILVLVALVILIAGLVATRRRRVLRRAGWMVFLLSGTAVALLVWSP